MCPDEMGACAMLSQQCRPENMVDCCMGRPQKARNACLCTPEWGSIEERTPDSGPVDQRETVVGAGRAITYLVVGPSGNDPGRFDWRGLHGTQCNRDPTGHGCVFGPKSGVLDCEVAVWSTVSVPLVVGF